MNLKVVLSLLAAVVSVTSAQKSIQFISDLPELPVKFLTTDPTGNVYVVFEDQEKDVFYKYVPGQGIAIQLEYPKVSSLLSDKKGNVFFTWAPKLNYQVFAVLRPNQTEEEMLLYKYKYYDYGIQAFIDDMDYVYVTDGDGLCIVQGTNVTTIKNIKRSINLFITDHQGNVYISHQKDVTVENAFAVIPAAEKLKPNPSARNVNGISDSSAEPVIEMAVDSKDDILIAIAGADPGLKRLTSWGDMTKIWPMATWHVAVTSKDVTYATTYAYQKPISAYRIDPNNTITPIASLQKLPKEFFRILVDSSDDVFLATLDTHIYRVRDLDVVRIQGYPSSQLIRDMLLDEEDTLYLLGEDLFLLPKGQTMAQRALGLPYDQKFMVISADKSLYIATQEGLYVYV